ncbi:MAG: hypothetical protein CME06_11680 [Gemmatimonadetes bacterium]|nr:hypothetical protein [Gemmatimonadota bacterium]
MARILVVEDEELIRRAMVDEVERASLGSVEGVGDIASARAALAAEPIDIVILDLGLPATADDTQPQQGAGLALVDEICGVSGDSPDIVIITSETSVEIAVDAMRRGARDYLPKPFDPIVLRHRIENLVVARSRGEEVKELRRVVERVSGVESIVYRSQIMRQVLDRVRRAARGSSTVLIRGETGTGKELVARALHFASPRSDDPFVTVNCPAIPSELLESELFGHVRGAFTDAHASRRGKLEMADGGTVFLDEIGDMSPKLQAKILRVIQEREFERVGSSVPVRIDVRIVAATHRHLEELVEQGLFREDLYYRLNVLPIELPPLRERPADIIPLAEHFLQRINRAAGTQVGGFDDEAAAMLRGASWPGNIRELRNVVERVVNLTECGDSVGKAEIEIATENPRPRHASSTGAADESAASVPVLADGYPPMDGTLRECLDRLEKTLIVRALDMTGGNRSRAAGLLGLSRPALYDRIERYGM